jgi:hypothetical protein
MEVSFIEIYNETIRDLLREGAEQRHDIKIDLSGMLYIKPTTIDVYVLKPLFLLIFMYQTHHFYSYLCI